MDEIDVGFLSTSSSRVWGCRSATRGLFMAYTSHVSELGIPSSIMFVSVAQGLEAAIPSDLPGVHYNTAITTSQALRASPYSSLEFLPHT
jgi:hypothetical protein